MDPEESPELPPLKRGTYDLDAILAAAGDAEFAIPPPATKNSFNPFASSSPSAFRSSFNPSTAPSTSANDNSSNNNETASSPPAAPKAVPASRPKPLTRKPITTSSPATTPSTAGTTAKQRVSTLRSTLSKFSAPKKIDLEPVIAEDELTNNSTWDETTVQDHTDKNSNISASNINNHIGNGSLTEEQTRGPSNDDANNSMTIVSPTPSNGSSSGGIFKSSRLLRTVPFNRVSSPGAHLDPMSLGASSPTRSGSPVNLSTGSIGGLAGNDPGVYSTPSSSRPTSRPSSRPTSRPSSRVSTGNGKYHSRQLSSDSLASFNAMIGKEDPMGMGVGMGMGMGIGLGDEDDEIDLHNSGQVSFVVSDPEHLKILEGEIEDPFSPSMSAIDADADAYLSSLMQQSTSPFGSRKSNNTSRGQSPAFRSRRQRTADSGTTGGDESFLDSTDDALSDKEPHSKFRSSRTGTKTPTSPLARAVTRGSSHSPRDLSNSSGILSLDQVMSDSQGLDDIMDPSFLNNTGGRSFIVNRGGLSSNVSKDSLSSRSPPISNGVNTLQFQQPLPPVPGLDDSQIHPLDSQPANSTILQSSPALSPARSADNSNVMKSFTESKAQELDGQESGDINHVEVDIVVQSVNVHDEHHNNQTPKVQPQFDDSDLDDTDEIHYNHSLSEPLANEMMPLHDSLDIPESHAQSFAEWMSSSAEISRLDISPPVSHPPGFLHNHLGQPMPTFTTALSSGIGNSGLSTELFPVPPTYSPHASPHGTSFMASTSLGDASLLTSSFTPALSSPEATAASTVQQQQQSPAESSKTVPPLPSTTTTSPTASKKAQILEKRTHLLEDLLSKARERTKNKAEASQLLSQAASEREKAVAAANAALDAMSSLPSSKDYQSESTTTTTSNGPSVTFLVTDDNASNHHDKEDETDGPSSSGNVSTANLSTLIDRKEGSLLRRSSAMMLSSRIRDSTNLDAPRYSIREMEDMKKNVRMDLRIEITNEIREEYERSAAEEAAIFQQEIEVLKTALEKEKRENSQLKGVLDEFESSLADIAVSTGKEIQTLKEQNSKLTEIKEETEEAFIVLKTRYDELKSLNQKHVENEGILRNAVEALKQDFEASEARYEKVKAHADAKFIVASQEMEQTRIGFENEVAMLKAQLSRQEMQMRTLEQALEIKNKENEDLILFSEELIAKLS
ncbi:Transforming acidic coiled-coil-containing protein 3 [Linnemannia zychae]|nr:Transforming acidic coiled-coil-containing protein 3 [Linnemannia zychae]